ncbi:MAG: isochorismatase family protein [Candidatus Riflebacteria bacterium]|nr:isochorismatase family protein [Candidatus Riflebacteria bacterium]
MELLDVSRSLVTVIDLQGKLMEMIHRPKLVIGATGRLMRLADLFGVPVVLTEQYPRGLGLTHPEVRGVYDGLKTPKLFLEKTSFGCCGDDRFERVLDELRPADTAGPRQVVVAGIEAHVCVMATVVELIRRGHVVHVCWECVSSRGEEYRRHALERMQQAGAILTNHESVAFEWARHKDHPQFKAVNAILREGQLAE